MSRLLELLLDSWLWQPASDDLTIVLIDYLA